MINRIFPTGNYIHISVPNGSSYVNMSNPSAGMIRYNGNTQHTEVFDGYSWMALGGTANIGLTAEAIEILDWAKQRMIEDRKMRELAEKHPAMADAVAELDQAADRVKIVTALVNEENK